MNLLRSAATLCLVTLAGCELDTTTTPPPSLAAQGGALYMDRNGTDLQLFIQTAECLGIADVVTAQLDHTSANTIERGGTIDDCSDFGHCDSTCVEPRFTWSRPALAAGAATFEVTDGVTTWTFEVDQPAVQRTLERVSPTSTTLHVGEVVTMRLEPPSGLMSMAFAIAPGRFTLGEATGVTRTGTNLAFAIPAVSPGAATLEVGAHVALPVLGCTAPGGCTALDLVQAITPVTFAP